MGGPVWLVGERLDSGLQFLPILLIIWFAAPLILPVQEDVRGDLWIATYLVATGYVITNVVLGAAVLESYRTYRGPVLFPADVSATDKTEVVDFIAEDWRREGKGQAVPVFYDVGATDWRWVPALGRKMERWYPAPMTLGRVFDYELLRRHGLSNSQEGIAERSASKVRYVVEYRAARTRWPVRGDAVRHRLFGRLRVVIID